MKVRLNAGMDELQSKKTPYKRRMEVFDNISDIRDKTSKVDFQLEPSVA